MSSDQQAIHCSGAKRLTRRIPYFRPRPGKNLCECETEVPASGICEARDWGLFLA